MTAPRYIRYVPSAFDKRFQVGLRQVMDAHFDYWEVDRPKRTIADFDIIIAFYEWSLEALRNACCEDLASMLAARGGGPLVELNRIVDLAADANATLAKFIESGVELGEVVRIEGFLKPYAFEFRMMLEFLDRDKWRRRRAAIDEGALANACCRSTTWKQVASVLDLGENRVRREAGRLGLGLRRKESAGSKALDLAEFRVTQST